MGAYSELDIRRRNEAKGYYEDARDLTAVAAALGGEVTGARWVRAPSPRCGPHDRSLVVRFADNGGHYVYAYEGHWPAVKAHVAAALCDAPVPSVDKTLRMADALRIWHDTQPIWGTPAKTYLSGRGLAPPPEADEVLRWHPRCPFGPNNTAGCMVALFRDVMTDEPVAIHRTSINPKDRKTLGPIAGAAIKLWRAPVEGRLVVGEGIETVLAATRLGYADMAPPAWALSACNGIRNLPLVADVRRLVILVDNDAHGAGQRAADDCAVRWERAGRARPVRLKPKQTGEDFNDVLLTRSRERSGR